MKPDEKYMTQVNPSDTAINFSPPLFNRSVFMNEDLYINNNMANSFNLSPSEPPQPEMHCYYNNFGNCTEKNFNSNSNSTPSTFDMLRNFDLDLDETTDLERNCCNTDVDKIYSKIEKNNPNILATFCNCGIPCPISKVFVKRLIKLSLHYCDK